MHHRPFSFFPISLPIDMAHPDPLRESRKTCIIAIGNTLRGDDAVGHYVGQALEHMSLPQTEVWYYQQLLPELISQLAGFARIIIVDASVVADDVIFEALSPSPALPGRSAHQGNAGQIHALARQLHHSDLPMYTCAIRGYQFDFSETLSPRALNHAGKAIGLIRDFIIGANR